MPLNDNQFKAAERWFRAANREEVRNRLDFIWDGLTSAQRDGLIARIKADLNNEFDATVTAIQDRQTDLTGNI